MRELSPHAKINAVVKSNAYGHGLLRVADTLVGARGVGSLGVSTVDKGVELRRHGITVPIILYGYAAGAGEREAAVEHGLEVFVGDAEYGGELESAARKVGRPVAVHMKVDTGMGRAGCLPGDALELYTRLAGMGPHVQVAAVVTHLADGSNAAHSGEQIKLYDAVWESVVRAAGAAGGSGSARLQRHCANSAAILSGTVPEYDIVRPGIILYGYHGDVDKSAGPELRPVMELCSEIVFVKSIPAGTSVGYGMSWRSSEDTRVATIPVGYGDGYHRSLSNCGEVLVYPRGGGSGDSEGVLAPIVGRVCMDQLVIDVGRIPWARRGCGVTLFGDAEGVLGADVVAERAGTISYELLCAVTSRVPRIYIDD